MSARHLLHLDDLSAAELAAVLDLAERPDPPRLLAGKGAALLFEKPSARTRNSMEMAVVDLGGHPVTLRGEEVGFDVRETVEDVARTLACYHALIGARVFEHSKVERLAAVSPVPVVNMLSDASHPCQALADLLTVRRRFGRLDGVVLTFVGDGANKVCRSLVDAGPLTGLEVRVAAPEGHWPDEAWPASPALVTADPAQAVDGAHVVYTDVWASMGQEDEAAERRRTFAPFTVDEGLMAKASPDAMFLHCLPAHRGEECTAGVIDGPQSGVWQQAENRRHAQRGLLLFLLDAAGPGAA